jgi:hypothetical protein
MLAMLVRAEDDSLYAYRMDVNWDNGIISNESILGKSDIEIRLLSGIRKKRSHGEINVHLTA